MNGALVLFIPAHTSFAGSATVPAVTKYIFVMNRTHDLDSTPLIHMMLGVPRLL
jgi:hypothetical protein